MVRFTGALATHGKLVIPHLGLKYMEHGTSRFHPLSFSLADSIKSISASSWEFVERAMYDVINSSIGTGRAAKVRGLDVFGKTGTAQNPHGEAHSWFIGYSKEGGRTLAVTVLIEQGGSGGGEAAVTARQIFSYCHKNLPVETSVKEVAIR